MVLFFIVPPGSFSIDAISFKAFVDGGVTDAELFRKLRYGFLFFNIKADYFLSFILPAFDMLIHHNAASFKSITDSVSMTPKFLGKVIGRYASFVFLDNSSSFRIGQMFLLLFDAFYDRIGVVG